MRRVGHITCDDHTGNKGQNQARAGGGECDGGAAEGSGEIEGQAGPWGVGDTTYEKRGTHLSHMSGLCPASSTKRI